jgi:tRNA(Ile)-lysidine synthase
MVGTRRLNELVRSANSRLELPSGPLTVALSGGGDSAALAFLVHERDLSAASVHIDHGLAGSPMLRQAAIDIAAALDMDLEIIEVEVGKGPSPEGQARQARYEVLDGWDGSVLTAHTRDDNAETMLINLIRGTGAAGLAGIPYHRPPTIYRPMLAITRDEAREMAALAGLAFRDDPMNSDPALARNRVRHQIIPRLREMNPRVVDALARAAVTITADSTLLDEMVEQIDTTAGVAIGILITLPRPLADRVLGRVITSSGVELTEDRLQRAWSVVDGSAPSQDLAGGLTLRRSGALIVIE